MHGFIWQRFFHCGCLELHIHVNFCPVRSLFYIFGEGISIKNIMIISDMYGYLIEHD